MYLEFWKEADQQTLSSYINQKHVPGKGCYSRVDFASMMFMRNK